MTTVVTGFSTANEATANSGIDLDFNLVLVEKVGHELSLVRGGWRMSSSDDRAISAPPGQTCLLCLFHSVCIRRSWFARRFSETVLEACESRVWSWLTAVRLSMKRMILVALFDDDSEADNM